MNLVRCRLSFSKPQGKNNTMSQSKREKTGFLFSFGLEKLGLVALRAPWVSAILILMLSALAVLGVMRLKVDDSLSELFRTDTKEFHEYEAIDRLFPSSEYDILVVVEGEKLLKPKPLTAFGEAVIELQLADGVNGAISMLSARTKLDGNGYAAPIIPDDLPTGAAYDAVINQLRNNEIVKGKFLSDDGQLALIVVSLDRAVVAKKTSRVVIEELRYLVGQALKGSGLNFKFTGAPVMQLEIRNAVERDRLIYNGLGFLAGLGIAYLFFRRLSLTLIVVAGPAIAILWTLGVIGALDYRLNLFINVITPLILVSGFSDSMHLVFAVRRAVMEGVDHVEAARAAVLDIAPACLLTAMNAAVAVLSFSFAQSALIRTFGKASLLAVGISYLAVAIVVPTLAALLVRKEKTVKGDGPKQTDSVGLLQRLTDAIISVVSNHPIFFTLCGVASVVATGLIYGQLQPRYKLADQVPDKEQALAGTAELDKKLTGANPIHIMIRLPERKNEHGEEVSRLYNQDTLDVIREVHNIVEQKAGLGNTWSVESLRRWLAESGDASIATIKKYIEILPEHLVRRFISKDQTAVLVTARLPDIDASEILPVVDLLDNSLDPIRKAHIGYHLSVTGLPAIAARNSSTLIRELNWGLLGDMFVIFIFLGIALRSIMVSVTSIMPSLFPIYATGTLLYSFGEGMQFASIIAITVAFSLAIDSTIHFLNRYRLEEDRMGKEAGDTAEALRRTVRHIGPAVVVTTIVLALGLGVTVLSDLPSLRLFGQLSAACLFASLVAQLIILPASIATYRRFFPRFT